MGTGWFPRCCLWLRGTVAFRGLCNYTTMFRYCIILHSANTIVQRSERVMAQCLESPSHRQTETPFLPVIISSVSKPNPYFHYRSPNHATLARREKKKKPSPHLLHLAHLPSPNERGGLENAKGDSLLGKVRGVLRGRVCRARCG